MLLVPFAAVVALLAALTLLFTASFIPATNTTGVSLDWGLLEPHKGAPWLLV